MTCLGSMLYLCPTTSRLKILLQGPDIEQEKWSTSLRALTWEARQNNVTTSGKRNATLKSQKRYFVLKVDQVEKGVTCNDKQQIIISNAAAP